MNSKFDKWLSWESNLKRVRSLYGLRPYHNWNHVEKCIWLLKSRLCSFITDELLFATIYHDVIYNPSSKTNEEDSVEMSKLELSDMGLNLNKIESLILSTKHIHDFVAADDETECILDVDLSILGSPMDEYNEYSRSIREEYLFINYIDYSKERIKFLEKMISRERIFYKLTDLELVSRKNMKNEILHLRGQL